MIPSVIISLIMQNQVFLWEYIYQKIFLIFGTKSFPNKILKVLVSYFLVFKVKDINLSEISNF